jgi:hypothetical protein
VRRTPNKYFTYCTHGTEGGGKGDVAEAKEGAFRQRSASKVATRRDDDGIARIRAIYVCEVKTRECEGKEEGKEGEIGVLGYWEGRLMK